MRLSRTVLTAVSLTFVSLTGCATHTMSMNYQPTATNQAVKVNTAEPTKVVLGSVKDSRESESNWLGAVRGSHGLTKTRIYTDADATDVLSIAFEDALSNRGLLGESATAAYQIDVDLIEFDSSQNKGKKTRADIAIIVSDTHSGQAVLQRHFRTQYETGHSAALRKDAAAALAEFANLALNESVDQVLNDPAFLALVRNQPLPDSNPVQLVSASLVR